MSAAEAHRGSCHCGRVRFQVTAPLRGLTECNCSICEKKGFLHWIVLPEEFQLLSGVEELTTYRFNTGIARHQFCRHCGVEAFYVPRSDPDKIDVNVRCLDDIDLSTVVVSKFDGRNWETAMSRDVPWREGARSLFAVVTLTVKRSEEASFRAYETAAAAVMRRHGGAIVQTVRGATNDDATETFTEAHLVRFPDESAFDVYRRDPELVAAAHLREAAVVATTTVVGPEGPHY